MLLEVGGWGWEEGWGESNVSEGRRWCAGKRWLALVALRLPSVSTNRPPPFSQWQRLISVGSEALATGRAAWRRARAQQSGQEKRRKRAASRERRERQRISKKVAVGERRVQDAGISNDTRNARAARNTEAAVRVQKERRERVSKGQVLQESSRQGKARVVSPVKRSFSTTHPGPGTRPTWPAPRHWPCPSAARPSSRRRGPWRSCGGKGGAIET